jgi:hypothetical protein
MSQQETTNAVICPSVPSTGTMESVTSHLESFLGGSKLLTHKRNKKSTKMKIGDIGYAFRKEFGAQGWFTGTVVKIMKDGDRQCEYSDGDVEDLLLDDLVQLAKLDPANNRNKKSTKMKIGDIGYALR